MQPLPQLVNFFRFRHSPGWRLSVPRPGYGTLTFLAEGVMRYVVDGQWVTLRPGGAVLMCAGADKRAAADLRASSAGYSVHYAFPQGGGDGRLGLPPLMHPGLDPELLALFAELDSAWLEKEEAPPLRADGLFLLILSQLHRLGTPGVARGDRRVETIKRYLLEHMAARIDSEEIAAKVGLSPVYMGMLFKRQTRLTLRNYANRLRVRRAVDMLRTGTFTVGEVAEQCGFAELCYFSRVFKRWTGVAPKEFLGRGGRALE